jgi:cytochrome P450
MLHDPNIFAEPDRFYPERWFSPNLPAFPNQAFGFGARLCPGRFFARRSMWANIAGILAAFDIVPIEGAPPEEKYSSGMISCVILEFLMCTRAELTVRGWHWQAPETIPMPYPTTL